MSQPQLISSVPAVSDEDGGRAEDGAAPARRQDPDQSPFMSIAEAAAMFDRAPRTVRWWLASGRLPHVKIGGAKFIPRAAIDRLIDGAAEGAADGSLGSFSGGEYSEVFS